VKEQILQVRSCLIENEIATKEEPVLQTSKAERYIVLVEILEKD
jgi:hypothetical protein